MTYRRTGRLTETLNVIMMKRDLRRLMFASFSMDVDINILLFDVILVVQHCLVFLMCDSHSFHSFFNPLNKSKVLHLLHDQLIADRVEIHRVE